mmetsp:Transcript_1321/g.3100  ORF Transcript_1321/g.3100 Transcript_1321/m.3100 type:complete len:140 (+) Transcript_1321:79-498(+)|eukprot:CAMPEP_0181453128 /NCGR_PEP_ID=MMETSP1110-20121109/29566_1 /TAXON_ID=174948 /ORGANISM="Symbiodinium sp., Strain CCMP421" /LENGTH=139 /DNA_ID=CAMNT_0023577439 /DNA_START=74 /DNA_END=493 /DNA_ORIENTATION=-
MASSVKMAMQARKAKGMADDLAGQAGGRGAASSSSRAPNTTLDEDEDEDSGAEEVVDGKVSHKIKGEKKKIEAGDFFDDLMEGFAEIWRLTVAGGHSFASCVRRVAYPLKESAMDAMDSLNTDPRGRSSRHVAPTFVHQ